MTCPLCGQRKARRSCPGVGQQICAICCGTKRLVEIRCPESCPYLHSAREHPPAVVQKQQQLDVGAMLGTMSDLTERQQQLLFLLLAVVRDQQDDPLRRLLDTDVADAATTLASTYETASKGVIYEHHAATVPAQRLVTGFREMLESLTREGVRIPDTDIAMALRSIARGATGLGKVLPGGDRAYVEVIHRMLQPRAAAETPSEEGTSPGSGLILPG